MLKIIALFIFLTGCSTFSKKPNISFVITDGVAHPESAIYSDEHQAIFVSNVASGNPVETKRLGHISKYNKDGTLIKSPWIKGLKAPKGMAIVGNYLYVSDVNQIVKIDIKSEKIFQTATVSGAKFLNDVAADAKGNIYVSDMMTDTIHVWDNKGVRVWLKSTDLRSPNGLYTDGKEHILLASWGKPIDPKTFATKEPGTLMSISLKDKKITSVEDKSIRGNLDGITVDNSGKVWISDWMNGNIYKVKKNGRTKNVYNLSQGTADITFAKELNLLLVPQMSESKVLAIKVR